MIGAGLKLAASFARLSLYAAVESRNISTASGPLCFQMTNILCAEPLKKKKRIDPNIVRLREERKKRKIEKQIRRLEKLVQIPKDIEENKDVQILSNEISVRRRKTQPVSAEEAEKAILLEKKWCKYRLECHHKEKETLLSILVSQETALAELKAESEDLYQKAIELDPGLMPYEAKGPVNTPPIPGYTYPDGEYQDITRKYEGE